MLKPVGNDQFKLNEPGNNMLEAERFKQFSKKEEKPGLIRDADTAQFSLAAREASTSLNGALKKKTAEAERAQAAEKAAAQAAQGTEETEQDPALENGGYPTGAELKATAEEAANAMGKNLDSAQPDAPTVLDGGEKDDGIKDVLQRQLKNAKERKEKIQKEIDKIKEEAPSENRDAKLKMKELELQAIQAEISEINSQLNGDSGGAGGQTPRTPGLEAKGASFSMSGNIGSSKASMAAAPAAAHTAAPAQ